MYQALRRILLTAAAPTLPALALPLAHQFE